jgi:Rad3-related DNA helicase
VFPNKEFLDERHENEFACRGLFHFAVYAALLTSLRHLCQRYGGNAASKVRAAWISAVAKPSVNRS